MTAKKYFAILFGGIAAIVLFIVLIFSLKKPQEEVVKVPLSEAESVPPEIPMRYITQKRVRNLADEQDYLIPVLIDDPDPKAWIKDDILHVSTHSDDLGLTITTSIISDTQTDPESLLMARMSAYLSESGAEERCSLSNGSFAAGTYARTIRDEHLEAPIEILFAAKRISASACVSATILTSEARNEEAFEEAANILKIKIPKWPAEKNNDLTITDL